MDDDPSAVVSTAAHMGARSADLLHQGRDRLFSERAEGIDPLRAEEMQDGDAAQLAPALAVGAEGDVSAVVEEAIGGALQRAAAEDVVLGLKDLFGHGG